MNIFARTSERVVSRTPTRRSPTLHSPTRRVRLRMPVGNFVYQKSAKKPRPDADACEIECKRHACAIQRCISRLRAYKSSTSGATLKFEACAEEISRYDACCERVKRAEASRVSEA